ncbi:MAG: hypothetical protein L0Y58_05020 [Verrucomicrobia subdivision 3 bacterium]|nr:hypothetical protein [Limisphaerales bacterium]
MTNSRPAASIGQNFSFVVTVLNPGAEGAIDIVLTNRLPPNAAFIGASASQGSWMQSADMVTCHLGGLPAGGAARVTIELQATQAGWQTNSASVSASPPDPNGTNNTAFAATLVTTARFFAVARMNVGHAFHTATMLSNDTVFVVGNAFSRVTDIYDPQTRTFIDGADMPYPWWNHGAARLLDGTVLITSGGGSAGTFPAGLVYDPFTGTFRRTLGDPSNFRTPPTTILLPDGRVLLYGGNFSEPRGELYDPATEQFTLTGPPEGMGGVGVLLANGKVLLAQPGAGASRIYDPATGNLSPTGDMPEPHSQATRLSDGRVLLTGGGATAELYDPASGMFTFTGPPLAFRYNPATVLLPNGKVLIAGGASGGFLSSAELYDPATGTFSWTASLNTPRESPTATLLPDGTVLIAGGLIGYYVELDNAEIYDPTGAVQMPGIRVNDASAIEGNSGTNFLTFTLSLTRTSAVPVSAKYETADITARRFFFPPWERDYVSASGLVTFDPGVTNQTVLVAIHGDTFHEKDETFQITLAQPVSAFLADETAIGTILNDDAAPSVAISPAAVSVGERDTGLSNLVFSITLAPPSGIPASVAYSTANQSALAGSDYVAVSGSLSFLPSETTKMVSVPVLGDLEVEPDETFRLYLTNAENAVASGGQATCTILNDDGLPGRVHHFAFAPVPQSQLQGVPFPVIITAQDVNGNVVTNISGPLRLAAQTTNVVAANLDFESAFLAPWQPLNGSELPGPYEIVSFDVDGDGQSAAAFRTVVGAGKDGVAQDVWLKGGIAYTFSANVAVREEVEGCWAGSGWARLEIGETNGRWFLPDLCQGTAIRQKVSVTYTPPTNGVYPLQITFERGYSADQYAAYVDDVQISYPVITPTVASNNFINGAWSGSVTALQAGLNVSLLADDGNGHKGESNPFDIAPTTDLALSGSSRIQRPPPEPLRTGVDVVFTIVVTNRGPSAAEDVILTHEVPASFSFVSASSSQGACSHAAGIVSCALGTLSNISTAGVSIVLRALLPGAVSNVFSVATSTAEPNSANNSVTLTNTILPPVIYLADASTSAVEASAASTGIVFNVLLSGPSGQTITVGYFTADATAFGGVDYVATNGTLTIPSGVTNALIHVLPIDDDLDEPTRVFHLSLTNAVNAVIINPPAVGAILDDDPPPVISISDAVVVEGDTGTTNAIFELTMSKVAIENATLVYSISNGTADSTNDFVSAGGTRVFPAGTTNQTITVAVRGNTVNEPDETFYVNIYPPLNATLERTRATGTILNDDAVTGRLDHFAWDPVPSPSYRDLPTLVTVRALDYAGNPASNGIGAVRVTARTDSGVAEQLFEDFEDGNTNGWINFNANFVATVTNDPVAAGNYSLRLTGGTSFFPYGLRRNITNSRPNRISFYVRASRTNAISGRFIAWGGAFYRAAQFYMNNNGRMGLVDAGQVFRGVPYESNRWYHVALDLNWMTRRVDCRIDGSTVLTNIAFPDDPYSGLDWVVLANQDNTTSWWDDIRIHNDNLSYALFVTPSNFTGFVQGVKSEEIRIGGTGTNVFLTANDGLEHVGQSGFFDVLQAGVRVLTPPALTEGAGPVAAQVVLAIPLAQDAVVTLTSSDTNELTVPNSVIISAGQTNATFNITVVNDSLLDGAQPVTISASTAGLAAGSTEVWVQDDETATLTLIAPASVPENIGSVQARVRVNMIPAKNVPVELSSSDTNAAQLPPSVVIPAGQTSVVFNITIVNDRRIDGSQATTLTAHVANWTDGTAQVTVIDDENTNLLLTGSSSLTEGSGATSFVARISGTIETNLTVTLNSSDTSEVTISPSVLILAGQTSAVVNVTIVNDSEFDGTQATVLSASAPGFAAAMITVNVLDNELHHFEFAPITGTRTSTVPFAVTIYARSISGETIPNFMGVVTVRATNSAGAVAIQPPFVATSGVALIGGVWTGPLTLFTLESMVTLHAADAGGRTAVSNPFQVVQPVIYLANVPAGDVVYSPASARLWAIGNDTDPLGNVTPIDPMTGLIESAVSIGAGATRLVTSGDGQYVHAVRNSGTPTIYQFNTMSRAVERSWSNQNFRVEDIAGVPGNSAAVAVSWMVPNRSPRFAGVYIYDNGVARSNIFTAHTGANVIEFSDSPFKPTRLYGYDNEVTSFEFLYMTVDAGGVKVDRAGGLMTGFGVDFICAGDLIFATTGAVWEPDRGVVRGGASAAVLLVGDIGAGRYYQWQSSPSRIVGFDLHTLLPVGSMLTPTINNAAGRMVRFGTDGLAFRANGNYVALVRTPLLASGPPADLVLSATYAGLPILAGDPFSCTLIVSNRGPSTAQNVVVAQTLFSDATLLATSSSVGSVTQVFGGAVCPLMPLASGATANVTLTYRALKPGLLTARASVTSDTVDPNMSNNIVALRAPAKYLIARDTVAEMSQATTDLAYDPVGGRIYASAPNAHLELGNSVLPLDPLSGVFEHPIPVSLEPTKLAVAADGQYLYAGLGTEAAIQRVNLPSRVADLKFPTGFGGVFDLAVAPDNADVVAATVHTTVAVYDHGVLRPNTVGPTEYNWPYYLEFSTSPSRLYATFPWGLRRIAVDSSGATLLEDIRNTLINTFDRDIEFDAGRLFVSTGRVIDPEAKAVLGDIPYSGLVIPDAGAGRVFYLSGSGANWRLRAFHITNLTEMGAVQMPDVIGTPTSLIRWGRDGLAFRTSGGQIFIIRTTLADDLDADGMADSWEAEFFGGTSMPGGGAGEDYDGDRVSNGNEFVAQTNPNDPDSFLHIGSLSVGAGVLRIAFPTISGKRYRVERAGTLPPPFWSIVADVLGTGEVVELTDPSPGSQTSKFYRLQVLP